MKQNILMLLLKSILKKIKENKHEILWFIDMHNGDDFLAINGCSEDSYLTESSDNLNIKDTMQSEIFNISHSGIGSSSPTGTLKNTPMVISSSSKPITASNPIAQTSIALVAGSWYLELKDSMPRSVNLSLSQSEDVVFGTGSMTSRNVI
jgi:hypothetical protein